MAKAKPITKEQQRRIELWYELMVNKHHLDAKAAKKELKEIEKNKQTWKEGG